MRDDATFANFFVGERNGVAISALQAFAKCSGENLLMVWGSRGVGLTHLCQAVCLQAQNTGLNPYYLPLRDLKGYSAADVCEGLEAYDLICFDGLDEVCGYRDWEQSIFHLYNRIKDAGKYLLFASHTSPPSLPLVLPDLKSRTLGCVIYHLHALDDDEKSKALQMRARGRGFDMPEEVASYILKRAPRDTNELFNLLDRLDEVSLQQQRKLTIPFVKEALRY